MAFYKRSASVNLTSLVFSEAPMKSKIEQQKFYQDKTEKSFASLTNQQQVQVPTQSLSTTGVEK